MDRRPSQQRARKLRPLFQPQQVASAPTGTPMAFNVGFQPRMISFALLRTLFFVYSS